MAIRCRRTAGRAPRRRSARTGGSGPSAGARGGTAGRCSRASQLARVAEVVLDVGANDAGGVLGAEGEGWAFSDCGAGAVLPGVHLLGDDVGVFADAAGEERGVFEDGGADLAEVVAGEDRRAMASTRFQRAVSGGRRSRVPRTAFRGLDGVGMDFQCSEWRGWGADGSCWHGESRAPQTIRNVLLHIGKIQLVWRKVMAIARQHLDVSKTSIEQKHKSNPNMRRRCETLKLKSFRQRSIFFWGFIGAAFIAYAQLLGKDDLSFFVAGSLAWTERGLDAPKSRKQVLARGLGS